jgi:hypothetical protein
MFFSDQIEISEYLSTRSLNIFKNFFEKDKSKLVGYYKKNKNFLDIDNCGKKSSQELIKLSKSVLNNEGDNRTIKVANPEVSTEIPQLSKRASNIYDKYFDGSDAKLVSYVNENGDFLNIKNAGAKTSKELIVFVKAIIRRQVYLDEKNFDKCFPLAEKFEEREQAFLNHYLNFLCQKNDLVKQEISIKRLLSGDLDQQMQANKLEEIKFNILHCIEKLKKGKPVNEYVVDRLLKDYDTTLDTKSYVIGDKIYVLKLFQDIRSHIFNETESYIFRYYLNYSLGHRKHNTLKSTAEALELSRERIRQISEEIIENFEERFFSFYLLKTVIRLSDYKYDAEDHIITIDKEWIHSINKSQGTNYNHLLINKILGIIFWDEYSLLGSEKNYHSTQRHKGYSDFSWSYLATKQINKDLRLEDFFIHIKELVKKDYDDAQENSLKFLLFRFSKSDSLLKLKEYYSPIKNILRKEFGIVISGDNKFTLRRNTKRKNYEYALEILEKMPPSKEGYGIDVIAEKINERFGKDFTNNLMSLRSAINNSNEFIFFGRSSHYGLKKWEEEFDEIQGGTIKSIAKEYISNFNEPQHMGKIAIEVNKYRETTANHILANLKLDPHENFVFYHGGYIGLKEKDYGSFESINISPGNFTAAALQKFLPAPYSEFIDNFCEELRIRKPRLEHIIENKIKKGELISEEGVIKLNRERTSKENDKEKINHNTPIENHFEVNVSKELVKEMVEWDTKNGILSTKRQQYLAYFAYGIKKLTDYHKKNVRNILKILKEAGFKIQFVE